MTTGRRLPSPSTATHPKRRTIYPESAWSSASTRWAQCSPNSRPQQTTAKSRLTLDPPSGISAMGHSSLLLQKFLQAQLALFESFRVFHSHVTVMSGLPPVAGLLLFASWIGQNESVLPGVMLEPPVSTRLREGHPDLVARGRVREINCGTELVLTVSWRRAHPIGVRPEDTHQPFVGELLLLVGAVGRSHHQFLSVSLGIFNEVFQVLGGLAPEDLATQGGNPIILQRDEVFGHKIVR